MMLICFDVVSFVMSFALECIVTLGFEAALKGTWLVKSLVINDVALILSFTVDVRKRFPSGRAWNALLEAVPLLWL